MTLLGRFRPHPLATLLFKRGIVQPGGYADRYERPRMVDPLVQIAIYGYFVFVGAIGLSLHAFLWRVVRSRADG